MVVSLQTFPIVAGEHVSTNDEKRRNNVGAASHLSYMNWARVVNDRGMPHGAERENHQAPS